MSDKSTIPQIPLPALILLAGVSFAAVPLGAAMFGVSFSQAREPSAAIALVGLFIAGIACVSFLFLLMVSALEHAR